MNSEHYKELWTLRFQKLLKVEKESARRYKSLIKKSVCVKKSKEVKQTIVSSLEEIYRDEIKHVKLVKKLISILSEQ